ncbi:hypothetical protein [Streptomyces sp. NPDC004376]
MDFKPGGFLGAPAAPHENTHPWKADVFLPFRPTPEQLEQAAAIVTFQREIDLIDTSFLAE